MDYLRSWIVMSKEVESKKSVKDEKKSTTEKSTTVKKNTKKETVNKDSLKKVDVKKSVKKPSTKKTVKDINSLITLEEADSFYHVSLLAQAVCVIGILAISVLAIFENSFTIPIEVLVGITLLIMAYNNVKLFKRKGLTMVYIVFGIISLIIGFLGYFGVTV
jgi:hypothetical protein